MNEKKSNEFIGIMLLALGAVLVLKALLGFTSVILFKGWWAVGIAALAIYNMIKNGVNKKNGTWAIVGAVLFINCRTGFLGLVIGKLIVPIILFAIGVRILTKNHSHA